MASVPSAGCLLARNQYYRKASVSSGTSLTGPDSANFVGDDKTQLGLPEVAESTWWFKSFFQSVPVLSNVKGEDQSACGGKGPGSRSKVPSGTNNHSLLQQEESQLLGEMVDSGTVNRFRNSQTVKDKPGPFHGAPKDTNSPQ